MDTAEKHAVGMYAERRQSTRKLEGLACARLVADDGQPMSSLAPLLFDLRGSQRDLSRVLNIAVL
jgi:hypothetical protein